jgi:hypothetical protein
MRKLLLIALALGLVVGTAGAQNINRSIGFGPDASGPIGVDTGGGVYFPQHILTAGKPPTLSGTNCVGGTFTGTDVAGTIVGSATPYTSCVVTFASAYLAAPTCNVTWSSGPLVAMSWTTSLTALTITQTSTASTTINYQCTGAK